MSPGALPPFPTPPPAGGERPRVSVVVVNHDYERFVGEAVDSALAQRGVDVEVIVVDDGSTDGSREVLHAYGTRIRLVLQPNRGQAAAVDAGVAEARGGVVLLLDADDRLEPGVAARAADAIGSDPTVVRVVFRLAIVDEAGRPTGELTPPADVPLAAGDVRRAILAHGDDVAWPPTSGNAFAAWALRRVLPLPPTSDRIDADAWLHPTVPLLGRVVALDGVGGAYRAHGANAAFRAGVDVARSRRVIATSARVHGRVAQLASELDLGPVELRSVTLAAHRLVSLRLGGAGHPLARDTRWRAAADGLAAAAHRTDVAPARRLAYAGWLLAACVAPRAWVGPLAEAFFVPARRPRLLRRALRRAAARPGLEPGR
ncbi:MAG TPA: glycosyltransferase family A protein [Solirubrobacteraceae bacterium]|nr:glycosyltransferase family A protein [Solirubrobacteraceae bacterium]